MCGNEIVREFMDAFKGDALPPCARTLRSLGLCGASDELRTDLQAAFPNADVWTRSFNRIPANIEVDGEVEEEEG